MTLMVSFSLLLMRTVFEITQNTLKSSSTCQELPKSFYINPVSADLALGSSNQGEAALNNHFLKGAHPWISGKEATKEEKG